jgi:hypothetical protein
MLANYVPCFCEYIGRSRQLLREYLFIVRSAKRCHGCILSLMYSANLRLEPENLTAVPVNQEGGCVSNL